MQTERLCCMASNSRGHARVDTSAYRIRRIPRESRLLRQVLVESDQIRSYYISNTKTKMKVTAQGGGLTICRIHR